MKKINIKAIVALLMVAVPGIGIVSVSAMAANTSHAGVNDNAIKVLETEDSAPNHADSDSIQHEFEGVK
jgi:hypothetical protein